MWIGELQHWKINQWPKRDFKATFYSNPNLSESQDQGCLKRVTGAWLKVILGFSLSWSRSLGSLGFRSNITSCKSALIWNCLWPLLSPWLKQKFLRVCFESKTCNGMTTVCIFRWRSYGASTRNSLLISNQSLGEFLAHICPSHRIRRKLQVDLPFQMDSRGGTFRKHCSRQQARKHLLCQTGLCSSYLCQN